VPEAIICDAMEAVRASRWEDLKLLLHPYLHWSRRDGLTMRGRTNVLGWLASSQVPLEPPTRFELRDGQIYRWWSA